MSTRANNAETPRHADSPAGTGASDNNCNTPPSHARNAPTTDPPPTIELLSLSQQIETLNKDVFPAIFSRIEKCHNATIHVRNACAYLADQTNFFSTRMDNLQSVFNTNREMASESAERAINKVLLIVLMHFICALQSKHDILFKDRCPSNLSRDQIIKSHSYGSRSTDVMLDDFRCIVNRFARLFPNKTTLIPDNFLVNCSQPSKTGCIGIVFSDYATMCNAFDIDLHTRFANALKVRPDRSGNVEAVQVIGSLEEVEHEPINSNVAVRKIYVGQGFSRSETYCSSSGSVLIQNRRASCSDQTPFKLDNTNSHKRPTVPSGILSDSEFALIWTIHPQYKKNDRDRPCQVPGKVTSRLVATVAQSHLLSNSIARELIGRGLSFLENGGEESVLYRVCTGSVH